MSRIPTPCSIEYAPEASRSMLTSVLQGLGKLPNMFRLVATSPTALKGYLGMVNALREGDLPKATRERIALAVAEINGCDYCLSAHTYSAKAIFKLDDAEVTANRNGASNDPMADAAVRFATQLVRERGHVSEADVQAVKTAGYDDAQILEIIQHVALNTFTNYTNSALQTEIDFPAVSIRKNAA